jgi:EAL domain-containing protein (putative c-di-GMP-specific phosphodiesterase class I)
MVLVRDIDKDFIKQELLKTLLDFANKTNSIVIAEGVETQAEYETVKELGVHYVQGYYFAKPSPQFIEMIQIL